MASLQGDVAGTVVTGLRRSEAMVVPWKASFLWVLLSERRRVTFAASGVSGGDSGRRSLAASQSSSTNYQMSAEISQRGRDATNLAEIAPDAIRQDDDYNIVLAQTEVLDGLDGGIHGAAR
jgi:hypothetical protein